MRRRRRKKHTPDQMEQQRRGRKIFRVLGRVLLTGIVLAAAVVAMTVFFRVKTISVEGAEQYGSYRRSADSERGRRYGCSKGR